MKLLKLHLLIILVLLPLLRTASAGTDSLAAVQQLQELRLAEGRKCGFPLILQAEEPQNKSLRFLLKSYRQSQVPLDRVYISASGRFRIYYTLDGPDAVPGYDRNHDQLPDYLEFVGKSFDRAWAVEVDSLGYRAPLDSGGHPRPQYPVYCRRIIEYGVTYLDYEIPGVPGQKYVTHIDLNTGFDFVNYPGVSDPVVRDSLAIAVTAAHEFNHALQMSYTLWQQPIEYWFIESSAVYMEEVVADEVNDYLQYLPAYFQATDFPLDVSTGGNSDYGKVVLELMLGKKYGPDIARRVWEEILNRRALPALEKVLNNLNSSLYEQMTDLAGWMFFTGNRRLPGKFFEEASLYPDPDFYDAEPVQAAATFLLQDSLPRLSFRWYRSETAGSRTPDFMLSPLLNSSPEALFTVFADLPGGWFTPVRSTVGFKYPGPGAGDYFYYAVVNSEKAGERLLNYRMDASVQQPSGMAGIVLYPQPLELSDDRAFLTFANLPENCRIDVFTSGGRHVRTLRNGDGRTFLSWDVTNKLGNKLGSGVYVYRVTGDNLDRLGKFLLVR